MFVSPHKIHTFDLMTDLRQDIANWRKITNTYQQENKFFSWISLLLTILLLVVFIFLVLYLNNTFLKLASSILLGLTLVRIFSLYHEYNHGAILRGSTTGYIFMSFVGFSLLAPKSLWRNYHNLHHKENSKFSLKIMGDFPTVTIQEFNEFTTKERKDYLIKRNFFVILFGYLTVFILSFNLRPFKDDPFKQYLGLICFVSHVALNFFVYYYFGLFNGFLVVSLPFLIFGFIAGVVFYLQHNSQGIRLYKMEDWNLSKAAVYSSSYIKMNGFWRFFTANVGCHSVHHLNPHIPHYHLPKAMAELENIIPDIIRVHFSVYSIYNAFKLKAYDIKTGKFVTV